MDFLKNIDLENLKLYHDVVYDKFLLAQTYKDAAVVLIDDIVANDNKIVDIGDVNSKDDYENIGKGNWTLYHNVPSLILPILFCTYQCIEQLLKGFVYIIDNKKYRHDTYELYKIFKEWYVDYVDMIRIFDKYVGDNLHPAVKRYMKENDINHMIELYNSLRYSDLNNWGIDYHSLKYIGIFDEEEISFDFTTKRATKFITEIKVDLDNLIAYSVSIYKKLWR